MGFKFRKSFKLGKGLRLNVGKRGLSTSIGGRGARFTIGSSGSTTTFGIPGTGLSWSSRSGGRSRPKSRAVASRQQGTVRIALRLELAEDGKLILVDEAGMPLAPKVERAAKKQAKGPIGEFLDSYVQEFNSDLESLLDVHSQTPAPEPCLGYSELPEPDYPAVPAVYAKAWWEVLLGFFFSGVANRAQAKIDESEAQLTKTRDEVERLRQVYAGESAERKARYELGRYSSAEAMVHVLSEQLEAIEWPKETSFDAEVVDGCRMVIQVDLPEIEDLPVRLAKRRAGIGGVSYKTLSAAAVRRNYARHIHGVLFRIVGLTFNSLPTINSVLVSGYSQRPNPKTGRVEDEYLVSSRVFRDAWRTIDFSAIELVEPIESFDLFETRRKMTKTGIFRPVVPFDC